MLDLNCTLTCTLRTLQLTARHGESVQHLAASLLAVLLLSMSAHSDTDAATARALADPRRPPEQVKLDATRKPAQLIAFAQLQRGDKVPDFMPGNAYFTRIMSEVVGRSGHVYAFLPTEQLEHCSRKKLRAPDCLNTIRTTPTCLSSATRCRAFTRRKSWT
jgi:predicted methyltransferase